MIFIIMIIVATRKCLYLFLFLFHLRNIKYAVTFRCLKCSIKYCGGKVHNVAAYCNSVSQQEIVTLLSLIFSGFLFHAFTLMKIMWSGRWLSKLLRNILLLTSAQCLEDRGAGKFHVSTTCFVAGLL